MTASGSNDKNEELRTFQIEIPREKVNALLSPKIIFTVLPLLALIVFSFFTWVSSSGFNVSGWSLGEWFAGGFVFWLSLILLANKLFIVFTDRSILNFFTLPLEIIILSSIFGIFIFSIGTSLISPSFGLIVSLVASVVLVAAEINTESSHLGLKKSGAREQDESRTIVFATIGIGSTFLPWSFEWSQGVHVMIPGWELGWGVGKYYFVAAVLSLATFSYGLVTNNAISRRTAGLLGLLAAFFAILALIKSSLSSNGISSTPNFGIAVAIFFELWSARALIGQPLTTLIKISTSPGNMK